MLWKYLGDTMNKSILTLALLAAPAFADHSLLEEYAREYNTPRKTERFMQRHYRNYQDLTPQRLNPSEDFLMTGLGDEKEMVNAAAEMMQRNGYAVKKMYYVTQSGMERYAAYVQDPLQQNNYLLHLEWKREMIPITRPEYIWVYDGHGMRMVVVYRTHWQERTYIAPTLVTGLGNETNAKMYLQHEPVVEWGSFAYDTAEKDGMKRMPDK